MQGLLARRRRTAVTDPTFLTTAGREKFHGRIFGFALPAWAVTMVFRASGTGGRFLPPGTFFWSYHLDWQTLTVGFRSFVIGALHGRRRRAGRDVGRQTGLSGG